MLVLANLRLWRLAVIFAVLGIICMSPSAPALDFASGIKALSCLAIANPKVTGMSAFTVFAIKLSRYANGKRTLRSSQDSASIID